MTQIMRRNLLHITIFIFTICTITFALALAPDQALNLNSNQFGINGPLQSNLIYSDQYGLSLNNKFTQIIGLADAIALELDFGSNEYRFGITWAHIFSIQQRIKITIERLAQNIAFDFASGATHSWIGQNAIGGEYQYIINHNWLNSLDISGYYTKANNKTLPTVTFWQNGVLYDNIRHIAGATSENLALGVDTIPWRTGKADFTLDYDNVHFNPLYETAQNRSGIGGSISIKQLLTKKLKVQLLSSFRQPFNQYQAGLFWLPNSYPGTRLEIGLNYTHLTNHTSLPDENRYGLQVNFSWGNNKNNQAATYAILPSNNQNLKDWVDHPIVHMPAVLAMRDQKVQRHVTAHNDNPSAINDTFPSSQTIHDQHLYNDGNHDLTLDIKSLGEFQPSGLTYDVIDAGHPAVQGLHFDDNKNGVLVIPKAVSGKFNAILVSASNTAGNTMQGFDLTITHVNDPSVDHINDQWGNPDQAYQFDAHNYFHYSKEQKPNTHNYLKYSMDPSSALFSVGVRDGKVTGTIPSDTANSPYTISIKADKIINDKDTGFSVIGAYKLYITPTASTAHGNYTYTKNSAFNINAKDDGKFHSNGSPELSYSLDDAPSWLSINASTGSIAAKANTSDYGYYSFKVIGTKTTSTVGAKQAIWQVNLTVPPLPATVPNQWADASNVNIDVSGAFTDPNRKLIYNITGDDGLDIYEGKVTGTLKNPDITSGHQETVTAKISSGKSQSSKFVIYANPALASPSYSVDVAVNKQIEPIPSATLGFKDFGNKEWWSYRFDGQPPPGITINQQTGYITGTPTRVGSYSFNVRATKAPPGIAAKSIEWSVTIVVKNSVDAILTCPNGSDVTRLPYTAYDSNNEPHKMVKLGNGKAPNGRYFDHASIENLTSYSILICYYKKAEPKLDPGKYQIRTVDSTSEGVGILPNNARLNEAGNGADFYELTP